MEPIEKDDHFIPDGMNAFERNVKRIGDCFLALGALIVFSPLFFLIIYDKTTLRPPYRNGTYRSPLPFYQTY